MCSAEVLDGHQLMLGQLRTCTRLLLVRVLQHLENNNQVHVADDREETRFILLVHSNCGQALTLDMSTPNIPLFAGFAARRLRHASYGYTLMVACRKRRAANPANKGIVPVVFREM